MARSSEGLSRADFESVETSTATLPRSWKRRGRHQPLGLALAQLDRPGQPADVVGDPARVPRRRWIALVDHPGERVQHIRGFALEPLEARARLIEERQQGGDEQQHHPCLAAVPVGDEHTQAPSATPEGHAPRTPSQNTCANLRPDDSHSAPEKISSLTSSRDAINTTNGSAPSASIPDPVWPPTNRYASPATQMAEPNIAELNRMFQRGASRTPSTTITAQAAISAAASGPKTIAAAM